MQPPYYPSVPPYYHLNHNITHPYINWNNRNDDKEEDDEYDDGYDNEHDSDNEMYITNNTIENSINIIGDKSDVENTTTHTIDHTDKHTIIATSWLPPVTNTINEPFIYSEINIIEDDPDNNINDKNAAKKKEKALQRQKAANIRRPETAARIIKQREEGMNQEEEECTENTMRDKFFEFLDGESSNDTDSSSGSSSSSSSTCKCDLHHDCPQHRWEHWSQRMFNYDKTYNYDRVDPVDTYILDRQNHWYFNTYIPRMLGGTMPP